jgi:hypothetical protein
VDSIDGLLIDDKGYLRPLLKQELLSKALNFRRLCAVTGKTLDLKPLANP